MDLHLRHARILMNVHPCFGCDIGDMPAEKNSYLSQTFF